MTEENLILATITHPAGYIVTSFAILWVRGNEDPNIWSVEWEDDLVEPLGVEKSKTFDSAIEAVKFFIDARHRCGIGMDYEKLNCEKKMI